jgi:hypothetical protein
MKVLCGYVCEDGEEGAIMLDVHRIQDVEPEFNFQMGMRELCTVRRREVSKCRLSWFRTADYEDD